MPCFFKLSSTRTKFVTCTNGMVSIAPLATLLTIGVNPTDLSFGAIMACTPAASAERKHAPKLCGSCTPSNIKIKGGADKFSKIFFKSCSV